MLFWCCLDAVLMLFRCCFDVAVQHLADVVLTLQSQIAFCIIQATSKQHLPAITKRHINNIKTTSKQRFGPIIRNLAYNWAHVTYNPTVAAKNGVCNIETASKQRLPAIPKRRFINIFGLAPCLVERTYKINPGRKYQDFSSYRVFSNTWRVLCATPS